jgi:hypothetical protein
MTVIAVKLITKHSFFSKKMAEFTTEAIKILYPKFQNLLSNASNELYRYSAEIYPNDYYANLALKHLRDTYFQPYLTGLTFLLCRYEPCKPLTRQKAINEYLQSPVMPDYKDTPEFKNWLKAERVKKEAKRQASIKEEERDDRQLKSEQQKTQQLTNYETKQGKELARQRRQLEFTREKDQQDQRMRQIEARLGSINQLETRLLALKNDVETRDRQALEYLGAQIEEGRRANVQEMTQAMEKHTRTYKQLALQCDNLTQQTRQAIEYQTKAIENTRQTLALEYEQKTEERIQNLAIQFEQQQTEKMKALALGYDKARIEAEQQIKTELNAQIQAVIQGNHLTYDNQQKALDQLRARYEQEFRDRIEAITNAQEIAQESPMGTTRAIIAAQASQIREQQRQALAEQTKQ